MDLLFFVQVKIRINAPKHNYSCVCTLRGKTKTDSILNLLITVFHHLTAETNL